MWAFLAIPLVRKGLIVVGGLLVIFLLLRWYGNAQYDQGVQKGQVKLADELQKQMELERKEKLAEIDVERKKLTLATSELGVQTEALNQLRLSTRTTLNEILASSKVLLGARNEDINKIPASMLDESIRLQSAKLSATASK